MLSIKKMALPFILIAALFTVTFAACGEDKSQESASEPAQTLQNVSPKKDYITDGHFIYTPNGENFAVSAANASLEGEYHIPAEYDGKKVTAISNRAFEGCTKLTSIEIGANITTVGEYAFSGCTALESVVIPRSVTSFGYNSFEACTSIKEVYYGGNVDDWLKVSLYHNRTPDFANPFIAAAVASDTNESKLYIDNTLAEDIVIPETVKVVNGYAFAGCGSLKSVKIPETVTNIRAYAFAYCDALEEVVFGGKVATIGGMAFYNCESIKELIIPDSVTEIGVYSFYNCKGLEIFTLPKSVKSIGNFGLWFNATPTFYYTGTQEDYLKIKFGTSAISEELIITYLN